MSRLPIRWRLALAFTVAMAVVLAVMGSFVYVRLGDALMTSVDQTLRSQAADAVVSARTSKSPLIDADVGGGTTLAEVLRPNGTVVRSSRGGLGPLALPALAGERRLSSTRIAGLRGEWRVLAIHPAGHTETIVVARSLAARSESLDRLEHQLLFAIPIALVLASLGGYLLASAALRPVEAMRRRAAAVTAKSSTRLPVPRSRDEVSRLAATLNEMLDRLHASLEHERRFVADASHELRTPLALRRPRTHEELEAALRSAAEETERLTRLAEDLLLIARGDRGTLPLRRADVEVEEVLETVASRFARRAQSAGASLVVAPTDTHIDADPERIEQALGNLVDNALTYGARSVLVSAQRSNGGVELHVIDDGEGFPDAFLARAFDRFSRADDARSRGGAGLGLSIVALIAAAHGGEAAVANRAEGGADVWISVPALS